ncbi:unnamed protein product [Phytophthora fragariaefolia]|uniref:Unnamed protein product n=1 Tax=Phytophthora fragariaefolia TaxID=1490495 RepID=A0A9W7D2P4_9STRA|nr:unnamed protein product [Phytophthora fragariaefolia]
MVRAYHRWMGESTFMTNSGYNVILYSSRRGAKNTTRLSLWGLWIADDDDDDEHLAPLPRGHEPTECPDWQIVNGVHKRRQRQCKVCSILKRKIGERRATKYYCAACSTSDTARQNRAAGTGGGKKRKKLHLSFGTSAIGLKIPPTVRPKADTDPSQITLPQTPKNSGNGKESDDDGVFGVKKEGTPYFEDSHVVTPRPSSRSKRLVRDAEASNIQRGDARASSGRSRRRFVPRDDSSDGDSRDDDYYRKEDAEYADPTDDLARQVRETSEMERLNSTLRLGLATHRPLAQIKAFSGLRNKSENAKQWLRTFVYEMKGTRTPPNERCIAFELSLRDGALHWYRKSPRRTKCQWKLLSDAFMKYYCSQFRQSAKARCDPNEHVNRLLESCGGRGLERRVYHLRVKDIHELEGIINDILTSPANMARTDVTVSMDRVRRAEELITLPTTATSVVNCVNKCTMLASVKLSRQ